MKRRKFLSSIFGTAAATAVPTGEPAKQAMKLTDFPGWPNVVKALIGSPSIYWVNNGLDKGMSKTMIFKSGVDVIAANVNPYNHTATVMDTATGMLKEPVHILDLAERCKPMHDALVGMITNNPLSVRIDDLKTNQKIMHLVESSLSSTDLTSVKSNLAKLEALNEKSDGVREAVHEFIRKVELNDVRLGYFPNQPWSRAYSLNDLRDADIDKYEKRVSGYVKRVESFTRTFNVAKHKEFALKDEEFRRQSDKLKNEWLKFKKNFRDESTERHKTSTKTSTRTTARKLKAMMRPTGMELQLTPFWELGPTGPMQFTRKTQDRY